jgi:hypothetical protein
MKWTNTIFSVLLFLPDFLSLTHKSPVSLPLNFPILLEMGGMVQVWILS